MIMRMLSALLFVALGTSLATWSVAADVAAGEAKFKQLCSTCHGPTGLGDGPAAAGLRPKPRPLGDPAWQDEVDDAHIAKVITEGGAAVGLSPMMTPWGHALKGDDLANVLAYIRSLRH